MSPLRLSLSLCIVISLSACGLGETAATLQAKQAQQAQEQMQQLKEQIDQANALNQQRLQQGLEQQQ